MNQHMIERNNRRYDIDWLRNICVLLLFPFHSSRVFDYWDEFYMKSDDLSWVLSWFISLTGYWFMPLLFWLAGASSWYALESRSVKAYLYDRCSRLLVPLLVGILLVVPPQGYFAQLANGRERSYLIYLPQFFTDFHDLSGYTGGFSPNHLWFILYLFILSVISLPLMTRLKRQKCSRALDCFASIFSKPLPYILFSVPLTLVLILPAPGGKNPVFFLVIYLLGFLSTSRHHYQEMMNRYKEVALLISGVLVPFWAVLVTLGYEETVWVSWLKNVNLLLAMSVLLGYGNKYLSRPHKWLAYINEAAFPVYIVHQTVLVVISYYILHLQIGLTGKFLLIMLLTFVISLALYDLIIKRIAATRWIFGVKSRKKIKKPIEKVLDLND